jgi:protein TonB
MKHLWGCLGLSIALHLSAGWLVRDLQAAPEPLAFQPPMSIQLVTLAPLAEPVPAPPAPPKTVQLPVTAATPPKPSVAPKAEPAPPEPEPIPLKPLPISTQPAIVKAPTKPQPPTPSRAESRPAQPVELPTTTAQPPSQPAAANASTEKTVTPVAAAPTPMITPVVSLRPSFVSPPPAPRYPSTARRRNQQGVVRVEVRLDERGQQLKLTLVRSSGVESLDQAALEAVTQWRFRPEIVDGRAVPSRVEIPIEFALTANR